MVALEWTDVEPLIGYKVSDYIIQHKRVEDPSEAEVYTGTKINSVMNSFANVRFLPRLTRKSKSNKFLFIHFSQSGYTGGLGCKEV